MIPTWLKLSSIVCSSAGDTLSCAGRPTGPGISSLTYTTTSGHHRRYLPDFPEITGQSFRNPHVSYRLGIARAWPWIIAAVLLVAAPPAAKAQQASKVWRI